MADENGADPNIHTTPLTLQPTVAASVGTLAEFSAFVSRELDLNLKPATDSIVTDHVRGAAWAENVPSGDVYRARMNYFLAQQSSLTALDKYIEAAEVLIDTIRRIMVVYASADGESLDMTKVGAIFAEASAAHRTEAEHETDRENRRTGR